MTEKTQNKPNESLLNHLELHQPPVDQVPELKFHREAAARTQLAAQPFNSAFSMSSDWISERY